MGSGWEGEEKLHNPFNSFVSWLDHNSDLGLCARWIPSFISCMRCVFWWPTKTLRLRLGVRRCRSSGTKLKGRREKRPEIRSVSLKDQNTSDGVSRLDSSSVCSGFWAEKRWRLLWQRLLWRHSNTLWRHFHFRRFSLNYYQCRYSLLCTQA